MIVKSFETYLQRSSLSAYFFLHPDFTVLAASYCHTMHNWSWCLGVGIITLIASTEVRDDIKVCVRGELRFH